ncbi:threonine-phosphate decarboxylase CobD [Luteibacter aegosomatis]|uniref:threonine-phosphate decarboxylase CobD n=1 Tax=Luteibacter aegosomatis TaxID=2911537 RepID=UPI001FFA22FC|nr:threonine-phosphate decarboxylase CobD [Luteibacter aegosomatis]UPG86146.1 threonine-phosphate decarboxylase CobD [Luteibacter aegosomatis]
MLEHGGRLARAARRYGIPREHWLDLSTGVSPHAWPVPPPPPDAWHRLPEDEDGLLDAARAYYGVEHLLPVAGSQAAIQALPWLRAPCRVGVVDPGYAEHAHAWRVAGHDVTPLPMHALLAEADRFDVVLLISPNNPTGERASPSLAPRLAAAGRWLVVDEAFADTRDASFLQDVGREGIIVLRSIGKFFGLAGARAGFVAAWPALLGALAERLGPWTLAGPSRVAVAQALRDRPWQDHMRPRLREESAALAALLARTGLPPSGSTDLFHYVMHTDAFRLHDALARRGILVRLFDDPPALRFGLPPDAAAFARLAAALEDVLA